MLSRDVLFQHVFSRLFVYNILWEDAEVDETYLDLDEDSTVLGISAAGARLLVRPVEEGCIVERHDMSDHFRFLTEESAIATTLDRSRQYRRVAFYQVADA